MVKEKDGKVKLSTFEYERILPKVLDAIKTDAARVTLEHFKANTPKEKMEEFLSYPDHHTIHFSVASVITVKSLKEMMVTKR